MEKYNGWTNWDTWNTYNWCTGNTEGIYHLFTNCEDISDVKDTYTRIYGHAHDGIDIDMVNWEEIYNALNEE